MRACAVLALMFSISTQAVRAQALASQPVNAADQKELFAAREAIWRAWFADDTAQLAKLLPSSVAAGSPGHWQSKSETRRDIPWCSSKPAAGARQPALRRRSS